PLRSIPVPSFLFCPATATTYCYTLSLHDALPICDERLALAQILSKVLLCDAVHFEQFLICPGLFDGREVLALNILDKGDCRRFGVCQILYDDFRLLAVHHLQRTETPLSGNDFIHVLFDRSDCDRLQQAMLSNGVRKLFYMIAVKIRTVLIPVRDDILQRKKLQ